MNDTYYVTSLAKVAAMDDVRSKVVRRAWG